MKYHLLIFLFISFNCKADFNEALIAYENENFSLAYKEFSKLAKIGNKRAQFNLAVMYLNGEFVEKDLIVAYAWGKLSEHNARPEFSQIADTITPLLSTEESVQAQNTFKQFQNQYGDAQIYANLSPIAYQGKEHNIPKEFTIKPISRKAPRFPKAALAKGIQGWVTVGFEVFPDGSARNPYVIESFPEAVFDETTVDTIQHFKFELSFNDGVEPFSVSTRQTFQYTLNLNPSKTEKLKQIYTERLENLKKLATQESAPAQYVYAMAASSNVINKDNAISPSEVNQWLLKSAQNGYLEAQYHLGRNILRGQGCQIEKQKGIDWIVYAADQGHAKSARMAHKLLTKHSYLNNTDKPADYWLQQAAENGDADAQLDYAEFIIDQGQTTEDIKMASKYLDSYSKQRTKSYDFYRVSSLIYQAEGNHKKAKRQLNKAKKLADKLGWDI